MAQKYKTILTKLGKEKMASLIAGEKLELTHLAVGDGELEPNEEQTSLQNEKYRGNVQKVEISSTKGNRINILGIIPKDIGGFWIREVGVFDSDGDLIAVGNVGETYKSLASDGSDKELGYNMIIEVDNIDSIELVLDDSIIFATKKDLNGIKEDFFKSMEYKYIKYIGDGVKNRQIYLFPKSSDNSVVFISDLYIRATDPNKEDFFISDYRYGDSTEFFIYNTQNNQLSAISELSSDLSGITLNLMEDSDLNIKGKEYEIIFREWRDK